MNVSAASIRTSSQIDNAKWGVTSPKNAKPAKPPAAATTKQTSSAKTKPARPAASDVAAFLNASSHPQKAVIAAVRKLVLRAGPALEERVKWNAPSTHLGKDEFSAFNLRAKGFVQLVLLFPGGLVGEDTGSLEGAWPDRRFVRFVDEADVRRKKAALTAIVGAWVSWMQSA